MGSMIGQTIGRRFRSNMYILVCHTNRQPINKTIGVVTNRLVGMALKIQNALAIVAIIFILSLSNVLSSRYSIYQ